MGQHSYCQFGAREHQSEDGTEVKPCCWPDRSPFQPRTKEPKGYRKEASIRQPTKMHHQNKPQRKVMVRPEIGMCLM